MMTTRLVDPPIDDTSALLSKVLSPLLDRADARVLFLCDAGTGPAVVQRLRTQISRTRNRLRRQGRPFRQFRFETSIHPETHDGHRYDACVCWIVMSHRHEMAQSMQSLLGL